MQVIPQGAYAQHLFDNHAGAGTDSKVSQAVMLSINELLQVPANVPAGPDMESELIDHKANTDSALADTQKWFNKQTPGLSSLVILGESHDNENDHDRAYDFIIAINNQELTPTSIVFERGMTYPTPVTGNIIREANLTTVVGGDFGMGLNARQRSMVVAGFLVLLHAGGAQTDINRDLLFFGENHMDIFKYYDYFARHSNANYLLKEPRTYMGVRSYSKAQPLEV